MSLAKVDYKGRSIEKAEDSVALCAISEHTPVERKVAPRRMTKDAQAFKDVAVDEPMVIHYEGSDLDLEGVLERTIEGELMSGVAGEEVGFMCCSRWTQ